MAVNFATLDDTLSPDELGFATISTAGLASSSKVVHEKLLHWLKFQNQWGFFGLFNLLRPQSLQRKQSLFLIFSSVKWLGHLNEDRLR
jgi:hypothetical protein